MPVIESRDLVSISRPIFASLGPQSFRFHLGLDGYRLSHETIYDLVKRKWFNMFLPVVSAGKKQPKQV